MIDKGCTRDAWRDANICFNAFFFSSGIFYCYLGRQATFLGLLSDICRRLAEILDKNNNECIVIQS